MSSSPASDALQVNLQQFGQTVTHRPRTGSVANIRAIFSQGPVTPLTDNRQGRSNENTAQLVMGLKDTSGVVLTLDDQGEFQVGSTRWAVTNVGGVDGGYLVTLKAIDRKTMRHMHGNS
jgi:hypothetical protein